MGDALDFDAEADKLAKGQKAAKKARKPRAVKDTPAKAPRKKRAPKALAYHVHESAPDDLGGPTRTINAGVYGPFETLEAMIGNMAENGVLPGDTVVVFREVRRGPVKTKTWIG